MQPLRNLLAPPPKPPTPEPTPTPQPLQPPTPTPQMPAFQLPTWDQFKLGAEQVGQGIQQAGQQVQDKASQFKLPDWNAFKLGGAEPTVTGAAPSAPDETAGAGVPSTSAPAVGPSSGPAPGDGEIETYIRQAAASRGINPDIAVQVANSEGGVTEPARRGTFATGSSWWPFQLHYGGAGYESLGDTAGMGNSFTAATGIQPGDPNGWKASVDYALDHVAQNGWGAWYGARAQGITGMMGVGQAPAAAAPDAPPASPQGLSRAEAAQADLLRGGGGTQALERGGADRSDAQSGVALSPLDNPDLGTAVGDQGSLVVPQSGDLSPVDANTNSTNYPARNGDPIPDLSQPFNPDQPSGLSAPPVASATPTFPEPDYGPPAPVDDRGLPGRISDSAQFVAQGGLNTALQERLSTLLPAINTTASERVASDPAREFVLSEIEKSNLPEVFKMPLRAMRTADDMVVYLSGLLDNAISMPVRDQVIKPLLAAIGAEKHVDLPVLGEVGTADLALGAIPGVGQLGPMGRAGGRLGTNLKPSETLLGKPLAAAGDALRDLPVTQKAGEVLGGLRDLGQSMTRGLPGGAKAVVGEGQAARPTSTNPADYLYTTVRDLRGDRLQGTPDSPVWFSDTNGPIGRPNEEVIAVRKDALDPALLTTAANGYPTYAGEIPPEAMLRLGTTEMTPRGTVRFDTQGALERAAGPADPALAAEADRLITGQALTPRQEVQAKITAARSMAESSDPTVRDTFTQLADGLEQHLETLPPDPTPHPFTRTPGQTIASQSIGGALASGYQATQEEGATPQDVLGAAAMGAATGGLRGALGRRGVQQGLARIAATQWSDPNNRNLATMFGKPVPTPATTTPWYRRLAQGFTDDKALLNGWEAEIRARLGANAPVTEIISHLLRVNPDSVATQRLEPVMDRVRSVLDQAQVAPADLSVYLANVHDVDIAQAFGQRAYDATIAAGRTPAQAQIAFDAAANGRTFSGGRHLADIQTGLQTMASDLGPTKMQAVHDAAQHIWDLNNETRDRLFAAGGMDQATHAQLSHDYPHYVTTDIINHVDPATGNAGGGGGSVGQRQNALRALSAAGTAADRLDPLQSVAMNTARSERWIAKNAAFGSFYDLVNADPALATQLGVTPNKPAGTREVTGLVNGQRETLRVARPIAEVLEMGNSTALGLVGEVFRTLTGPFKAALTTYAAPFQYLVNPLRDGSDFLARQSAYLGGPQHLPEVIAAYARAVPDIFSGFREGKYTGQNTTAYHLAGGSYERIDTSPEGIARLTKTLLSSGGEQLKDPRRIASLVRDVLTLGARPMGERIEQIPRVAAFDLAQRRGATPTRAMIAGRDSTVAFEQGGRWVKALNTAIPFLNASTQATAQFGRALRDHPVATTASMAAVVGIPALAAEVWNRSDPQRQAAYDDVPSYLKNSGIVFMLPGVTGSDQRGPLPNYLWMPTGIFTPAATTVRAITQRVMKDASPEDFGNMLSGVLTSYSPVKDVSALVTPGVSTVMDLKGNRDQYRGRTIATEAADRNAGSLAKGITGGLNAIGNAAAGAATAGVPLVGAASGLRDVRPSQTEYAIRDLAGAPGQTAMAAADMVTGRDDQRTRPVQDVPVLGGIVGRVIRDTGGQKLQNAQDARISPAVDRTLRAAGLRPDDVVQPVTSLAQGVPLTRAQQLQYQTIMNAQLNQEVFAAMRTSEFRDPATREQTLRDAVAAARKTAADQVLSRIPDSVQEQLKRREALKKTG